MKQAALMRKESKKDKQKRKLEIRKETVRELSTKELDGVAGGYPGYVQPTKTGNCYY